MNCNKSKQALICAICRRRIEPSGESYSVGRHKYHWRCFMKRERWFQSQAGVPSVQFLKPILPASALAEPDRCREHAGGFVPLVVAWETWRA